jgi:hypothetical protein
MNLFFLHHDPKTCAEYHCDKHVVKMILELVQMLCTAHICGGGVAPYRVFNKNHPMVIWVRASKENYTFTATLAQCLSAEYTHRYNRIHACDQHIIWLNENLPVFKETVYLKNVTFSTNKYLEELNVTPVPLTIPEDVKCEDTICSYRRCYNVYKKRFAKWTNRPIPWWFLI